MADTYLDSSIVGFNHQDALDARVDTYMRLSPILNMEDAPAMTANNTMNLSFLEDGPTEGVAGSVKIDMGKALISEDPIIKQNALLALEAETNKNVAYAANIGGSISTPKSVYTDKFLGKDFGFSALRDNEDFYWKNDYMEDGAILRNTKNVGRFLGRVAGGAAFKLMEGFGYVGSLLTSIGGDNYWADVADNGFSKWFEEQEQTFKDQLIPIYKKAGFDEAGFFSKMFNPDYAASFWNDSVADGVAFMASAAIPGMALSKLGSIGALGNFGRAFSTASTLGRAASAVGLGSGAEVTSWTFNTAMEAAFEGAGVFKEVSKRLTEERDAGLNNLTDEDIRQRAGNLAGNTVLGNVAVLALSNAWENKLFFKKSTTPSTRAAVTLGDDFTGSSRALNQLADKGTLATIDVTNPLRRFTHYGKKLTEGLVMEGLWEENAQLAIQRMNQQEGEDGNSIARFANQLLSQTGEAFFGDSTQESRETAESIGLGAIIGMGAGAGFSKAYGERKAMVQNTKNAVDQINKARQDVFNVNDIYQRDENNKIVYDAKNNPIIDPIKLKTKEDSYKKLFKDVSLANANEYFNSNRVQFETGRALSNYVKSLHNIGVEDIAERFSKLNPENATLFGLDPSKINEQSSEYRTMVEDFEAASKSVERLDMGAKPDDMEPATFQGHSANRKALIYRTRADNAILNRIANKEESNLLQDLNASRTLNNASLSEFPVEQINSLIHQQKLNEQIMAAATFKDKSDMDQQYYKDRNANLKKEIARYKANNEIGFKSAARKEDGTYVAIIENPDGSHEELPNLPAVDKKIKDIAAIKNTQHLNTFVDYKLSDFEKGHDNYMAYKQDKLAKTLDAIIAKADKANQAKAVKFKELVPGDYESVAKLVAKMVFGENQVYTAEEVKLQQTYAAFIEELRPQYEQMVENQRIKNLDKRLNMLKESNQFIGQLIEKQRTAAGEAESELAVLVEEFQNITKNKRANQKRIKEAINSLQEKLIKYDEWVTTQEAKIASQDDEINLIGKEIEEGSFRGLYDSLEELKAEGVSNQAEITKNRDLITSLSELVKMLIKSGLKLFGKGFRKDLNTAYADGVEYISEISSAEQQIADAKAILPELEARQVALQEKFSENYAQMANILWQTDRIFKEYYYDLTKDIPVPIDADEAKIGDELNSLIPGGPSDGGIPPDDEDGFDGPTYQRPLDTKFFTTTFPHIIYGTPTVEENEDIIKGKAIRYEDLGQAEKDYFEFVDFVTNPMNSAEVKKKLGGGKIKSIMVTRNNVDALGLRKHLDKDQWFKIQEAGMTHMEIIPVIDDVDGYQYYVDSKLNKLSRVKDNKPEGRIVSRSLRTVKYTPEELKQYSIKYSPEQMKAAAEAATAWRTTVLDATSKSPIDLYNSAITRGIPNRQIMQDNLQAKNPVIGHLIPENEVNATSVLVFSEETRNEDINGEPVTLPVGRPFIKTNNGAHEQLHAANNAKLTPELVTNVLGVMEAMFKEHVAVVEDRLVKDTSDEMKAFKAAVDKAGSVFLLDYKTKKQLYLHLTNKNKSKGVKLFNTNYLTYLSGMVYFSGVEKGKDPHPNQMYFKGANLIFGDKFVDLTNPNFMQDPDLVSFLNNQFHNIKYFPASQKGGKQFVEYYMDGTELKNRTWKNYATYLLAEKTPPSDGSKPRSVIPVTTSIKTKEQHEALDTTDPYFQYVSRGITVLADAIPTIKKEVKSKEKAPVTPATVPSVDDILPSMTKDMTDEELDALAEKRNAARQGKQAEAKPVEVKPAASVATLTDDELDALAEAKNAARVAAANQGTTEVVKEVTPPAAEMTDDELDALAEARNAARKAGEAKPVETTPVVPDVKPVPNTNEAPTFDNIPFYGDEEDEDDAPSKRALRVAKGGVFKTEKDLDAVIADIKRMLPQFNIERLKNIIKTTNGVEAWGQFIDNTIKIYEQAEEGTAYHEAFEAVVNRILTDKEWNALYSEFKSRPGYYTDRPTGTRLRYKDATPHEAKEELAEEFRDYKLTGKLPTRPQAKSYFKILWDFIKSLFANRLTIEDAFKKIDEGGYAHATITNRDRFASNFRFKGLPPEVVQDLYDAATASMFINTFHTAESIAEIDEIDKSSEQIYEPIRADFRDTQEELTLKIQTATDENKRQNYKASLSFVTYALDNWANFKDEHIQYLKKYRIKFDPIEGQDVTPDGAEAHADELTDTRNRNDYVPDNFKAEGKRSASKSIKFLVASLMQLKFTKKNNVTTINGHKSGVFTTMQSSVFMQKLVNYDEYMFKLLDSFKDLNDFNRIEKKMRELAGMDEIALIEDEEVLANHIANMSPEKATWTSLYARLFGDSKVISEESAYKLKVKFHSYVSKFAPEPFIFIQGGSTSSIISATNRAFYESLIRKMERGISNNYDMFLTKNRQTGIWGPKASFRTRVTIDTFRNDATRDSFIKFLGLNEYFTPKFIQQLKDTGEIGQLNKLLLSIRNQIPKVDTPNLTIKGLDINRYTTNLLDFLDSHRDSIDKTLVVGQKGSQLQGINNEMSQTHITPSFISRLFADINNVANLEELHKKHPQTATYIGQSSGLLKELFDPITGQRTDKAISMGYIQGIKDLDDQEGTATSKLEFHDKYFQQFNASLQGLYYSLPADSETEWIFNLGEFVEYRENLMQEQGDTIIREKFLPFLAGEIRMAQNFDSRLLQLQGRHYKDAPNQIGDSLRFFKNILANDQKLLNDIHRDIKNKDMTPEKIIKKYEKKLVGTFNEPGAIRKFINSEVRKTAQTLTDNKLIILHEGLYRIKGLNSSFVTKISSIKEEEGDEDAGTTLNMTPAQIESLIQYQKLNTLIAGMEQFAIVFGDPAQYKDWEKRAKSLFSPVEQAFYDNDGTFDRWLNENKNKVKFAGESIELDSDDIFRTEFSETINSETYDDFKVVETGTVSDLQDIIDQGKKEGATEEEQRDAKFVEKYINTYEDIDETDGQSLGTLAFARQLLIKSGWRWTDEHENYYIYDTSLMRLELEGKQYDYKGNTALKELDQKIVAYFKDNPPNAAITPVKTLMPAVNAKGEQTLLKHSVHFLSYQVAKEFELLDRYVDMLTRNKQLHNFRSVQKVGLQTDDNGEVTPYYNDPFTKNDLSTAGEIGDTLSFRSIGIQVETQTSSKGQTLGTQGTKLINLNLIEDGLPTDFLKGEGTFSERKKAFNALSFEDKLAASENYNKVYGPNGTFNTLENLKAFHALTKFTELGITWKFNADKNEFEYDVNKLTKIKDYILAELQRLEVDSNTLDVIRLTEDGLEFSNPAETIPSYTTISNLLWSIADKSITSMKVNGKPMVQVSSAFFNKGSRRAAYKENGRWYEVNSKEAYDAAVARGMKMVMTSSELKFYRRNKVTGETDPMEVYLPEIYLKKVNKARLSRGLTEFSPQELMDHLNANPKLLEGIGFRIPTQATSSLDFFKIKGFLPEAFGSAIVVPSAITAKGGSDFDVDKLNTYLNNWKLGKDGLPFYETYKDESNSDVEDRFIAYVNNRNREAQDVSDEMKASPEYMNRQKRIDSAYAAVSDTGSVLNEANNQYESFYALGGEIFKRLPLGIKQQFWDLRDDMRLKDVSFEEAQAEYYNLTNKYIKSFEAFDSLKIKTVTKIGNTIDEIVRAEDVLDTLHSLRDNYVEVIEASGLSKESFEKLMELLATGKATRLEVAKLIASGSSLMDIDTFGQQPMFLQNTKGAVENAYFESMRNVLKSAENFTYLLSPNSISHIRRNRNQIYRAQGVEGYRDLTDAQINDDEFMKNFEGKRELDYTNFISTEYIAQKRNEFTKGKSDVGIFAVANTNFANSQVTGIGISGLGGVKDSDVLVFNTYNQGWVVLPFEDIVMEEVDGNIYIPISKVRDANGDLVMDKISSYINGAVDVAKDPFIIQMGMHTEMAGVYTLLERMGLTGKTTALFLYQPLIREYLRNWIFLDSKTYFGESDASGVVDLQKTLLNDYKPVAFEYDPNYRFTDDQLAAMIRKSEDFKKTNTDPNKKINWTAEEREAQYYALANFLKLKMYSNHLLEVVQASNHDTSSIRNSFILTKKDLQLERSETGNTIVKLEGKQEGGQTIVRGGAEVLRNDTYIKTDVSMLEAFAKLFSDINLFALQRENPRAALLTVAGRIFRQNPFLSNDDFIRIMREYEAAMIDSMINEKVIVQGIDKKQLETDPDVIVYNPLYKMSKTFFKTTSPNSLKKRFESIKTKYPKTVKNNFFLSNLEINTDQENGVDLMELTIKPGNSDVATKEKYTYAMMQIATLDDVQWKELVDFYTAVVYGSFIQNGIKFSRKSFTHLLPVTNTGGETNVLTLTDITKAGLSYIDTHNFDQLDKVVKRAKFHKKGVVKVQPQMAINQLHPYPDNPTKLYFGGEPTFKSGKFGGKPSKSSQTFFGSPNEDGSVDPHIHPIMYGAGEEGGEISWENMDEIIGIPAVRPKYLTMGKRGLVLNQAAINMSKKNDYTYMYTQLFQKVGIHDPSLGRAFTSKASQKTGKRYVSYLYKPIYSSGMPGFGEINPVKEHDDGSTSGVPSILDLPSFKEREDKDIVQNIVDVKNQLRPVIEPTLTIRTGALVTRQKPMHANDIPTTSPSLAIHLNPKDLAMVISGKKKVIIATADQAGKINIASGFEEDKTIAGTPYKVKNRGAINITEAGGLAKMSELAGVPAEDFLKYPHMQNWIAGKGKLFVYDILPSTAITDGNLPPIEPTC